MIEAVRLDWALLGARLANLSDEAQAEFFTGFAREFAHYESQYLREMQLLVVNKHLDEKDQKMLAETLPCLWMEDQP